MKNRILIFGSIIAVVILVLASFPSVTAYKESHKELYDLIFNIKDNQEIIKKLKSDDWFPGYLIALLITYLGRGLFIAIVWIFALIIEYLNS